MTGEGAHKGTQDREGRRAFPARPPDTVGNAGSLWPDRQ